MLFPLGFSLSPSRRCMMRSDVYPTFCSTCPTVDRMFVLLLFSSSLSLSVHDPQACCIELFSRASPVYYLLQSVARATRFFLPLPHRRHRRSIVTVSRQGTNRDIRQHSQKLKLPQHLRALTHHGDWICAPDGEDCRNASL